MQDGSYESIINNPMTYAPDLAFVAFPWNSYTHASAESTHESRCRSDQYFLRTCEAQWRMVFDCRRMRTPFENVFDFVVEDATLRKTTNSDSNGPCFLFTYVGCSTSQSQIAQFACLNTIYNIQDDETSSYRCCPCSLCFCFRSCQQVCDSLESRL